MTSKKASAVPKKAVKLSKTAQRIARAQVPVNHPGYTYGYKHQVFIAKLKRGEVWALNHLKFQTKAAVTPLLEMWPPNPGTPTRPAKPMPQHTTDLMQTLATEWTGLPCYIDTQYLQTNGQPDGPQAQAVFAIARGLHVNAVPVTSPYFPQPFQQAINTIVATDGRGVMFRLPTAFFNNLQNAAALLDGLAAAVGVTRGQVDILIDLGHRPELVEVQQLGEHCMSNLPNVNAWRTVTLASGSFPDSIAAYPTGTWVPVNRSDWVGWHGIAMQRHAANLRVPSYGDYGVRCGGAPVVIPNTPAPNLRYTAANQIWVRRGLKAPASMRAICVDLLIQPYFSGATFSQGDSDIAAQAATIGPANGSPEQWIQWCTNHHLERTALQIQNLP